MKRKFNSLLTAITAEAIDTVKETKSPDMILESSRSFFTYLFTGAVGLSLLSLILPGWAVFLGTIVLAKSLVVLGLSLLWRAGLVSFGQALFFGLGAYTTGVALHFWGIRDFFLLVLLSGAFSMFAGIACGILLARYRDIFFANLNLAFSMLLYGVLAKNETWGSTDGMHTGVPTFFGVEVDGAIREPVAFICTVAVVVVCYSLVHLFSKTTLGRMPRAIRDAEIRVEYLGYPPKRACHVLITIAALLAGVGGAIVAMALGHVDPEMVYWTTSGEFLFITILSGVDNLLAPILGAFVFELIRDYANQYFPFAWQSILGGSLLLTMMFLPNGLFSIFTRIKRKRVVNESSK